MPAAYPNELAALPDVFTYQDAKGAAVSDRRLKRGVDEGWLVKVGHGAYCRADAQLADLELVEVALRAPDATLCLASALARHELSDTIPRAIHVALPRSRRPPVVESVVEWHRFSDETFALGRMPSRWPTGSRWASTHPSAAWWTRFGGVIRKVATLQMRRCGVGCAGAVRSRRR
ncbi:MAG: type IV toxin-antitoxin system AbiEi family antitoxin domain-containing protein [Sandaracinaceae bacterium]|nr:type IV toxin-antitoxin system AbiEi family antitoxin domain-containing protein [Sandaracinaceae bacterium]